MFGFIYGGVGPDMDVCHETPAVIAPHQSPALRETAGASFPQGKPALRGTGDKATIYRQVNDEQYGGATRNIAFPWGKVARSAG